MTGGEFEAISSRSYAELERAAAHARGVVARGVTVDDAIEGVQFFEQLRQFQVTDGRFIQPVVDDLGPHMLAGARFDRDKEEFQLILSAESYSDLELGTGRARFSLAHEIGHLTLHHKELVAMAGASAATSGTFFRSKKSIPAYRQGEWQADGFAAAFLAPAKGVVKIIDAHGTGSFARMAAIDDIASRYGVSHESASIRYRIVSERRRELVT